MVSLDKCVCVCVCVVSRIVLGWLVLTRVCVCFGLGLVGHDSAKVVNWGLGHEVFIFIFH